MLALRFNTSALDDMFSLERDLNAALGQTGSTLQRRSSWTPAVEVHETEDQIRMAVELPGVNPQDVSVTVQNGVLTLAGQKKPVLGQAEAEDKGAVHYSERWYGQFERTFTLPIAIDASRIDASYDAGILTIRLHKSEQARPRQIQISVGANASQIGAGQK